MINEIRIKIIPHNEQRADVNIGDYWEISPGVWEVRVSDLKDWRKSMIVTVHELVELIQTESLGIKEPDIQAFDEQWAQDHPNSSDEPGNDLKAPYHDQHVFSDCIERLLCHKLGIPWSEHEAAVDEI